MRKQRVQNNIWEQIWMSHFWLGLFQDLTGFEQDNRRESSDKNIWAVSSSIYSALYESKVKVKILV